MKRLRIIVSILLLAGLAQKKKNKNKTDISLLSKGLEIFSSQSMVYRCGKIQKWILTLRWGSPTKCKRKEENTVSWLFHSNLEFRSLSRSKFSIQLKTAKVFMSHFICHEERNQDTDRY